MRKNFNVLLVIAFFVFMVFCFSIANASNNYDRIDGQTVMQNGVLDFIAVAGDGIIILTYQKVDADSLVGEYVTADTLIADSIKVRVVLADSIIAGLIHGDTLIFEYAEIDTIIAGMVTNIAKQSKTLGEGDVTFELTSNIVILTGDVKANVLRTMTGAGIGIYTLKFVDGLITVTDTEIAAAGTIDLLGTASDLTSADDTTLTLMFDGISFSELCRSIN